MSGDAGSLWGRVGEGWAADERDDQAAAGSERRTVAGFIGAALWVSASRLLPALDAPCTVRTRKNRPPAGWWGGCEGALVKRPAA